MHSWKLRFAQGKQAFAGHDIWMKMEQTKCFCRRFTRYGIRMTSRYRYHMPCIRTCLYDKSCRIYHGPTGRIATSTLFSKGYQLLLKEPDSLNTQRFSRGIGLRCLLMASIHPSRWQHDPEICLGTPIQLPYSDKECVANHELGIFVLDNRRILRTSTHFESPVHVHRLLFLFRRNLLDLGMFW